MTRKMPALAVVLVLAGAPALAQDAAPVDPVGPKLPPDVRALLLKEMNAIEGATQEIMNALVRGRNDVVAEKAQAIHDSFILKQEMTEEDRKALAKAAPKAFVERDRAFHALTGDLAEAARAGDAERQRALFGDVVEACAACHERYATNRFPAFSE
ncbi:cytochrome c [Caenispirillum salinarum]|uniref:cytochrome c n=1 Tax=Caenispirillum salinarum TaxID=859058 RepID=UPI00384DD842